MTVKQLISNLQEFPQDAEVIICEFNPYRGEDLEKDPEPDYYPHQNRVYL